jgi:ADP-ribose pyrophosphatase YjhB (NUDIX family)
MNVEFTEHFILDGQVVRGAPKSILLPFTRVSARAIVVRQEDGAVLGALHHNHGKFALPGGTIDHGEDVYTAVMRELDEENIRLVGSDGNWRERMFVDYYHGYKELSVWFVFIVEDAEIGPCHELVETRWIEQEEEIWYPSLRGKILFNIKSVRPDLLKVGLVIS